MERLISEIPLNEFKEIMRALLLASVGITMALVYMVDSFRSLFKSQKYIEMEKGTFNSIKKALPKGTVITNAVMYESGQIIVETWNRGFRREYFFLGIKEGTAILSDLVKGNTAHSA